jgi:glycogen operon protein
VSALPVRSSLPGRPFPLGATPAIWHGNAGVNLAVFAPHATALHCCLFDRADGPETARLTLASQTEGVWHGFLPGIEVGQLYGLRAEGPWQPEAGLRFNPNKLLIDPYAREIVGSTRRLSAEVDFVLDAAGAQQADLEDNASRIPKARVVDVERELAKGTAIAPAPELPRDRTILYEAHVKGLTRLNRRVPEHLRGTYAGLATDAMLTHYKKLGVTTLCLLPVQLHIDEKHLLGLDLVNYWGYNTLGFFCPDPAYASAPGSGQEMRDEFRRMVDVLHRSGLEVILDVVYNHTAESGSGGPTLSWRGLDNRGTYLLDANGHYLNFTGCGNTLNASEPRTVQFVLDSLRWWVGAFGIDGFRFDLAATLGRDSALHYHFNPRSALLTAIAQDPVLARVRLVAEPWDVAPGGYQVGAFPRAWQEWNDRFRDVARMYWLGHECTPGEMARRMTGSDDLFAGAGRSPLAGINLVTAHDGFTLADVTAYRGRHNEANGEENRDGHGNNHSANAGVEGPSGDAAVEQLRGAWRRALLASLFLAQGTPQLLAGDEMGNSQHGNNNAYCQDNELGWVDWRHSDADSASSAVSPYALRNEGRAEADARASQCMISLVGALSSLRRRYPALRHPEWFRGHPFHEAGHPYAPGGDIVWLRPDGMAMWDHDWQNPWERSFAYVIEVGEGGQAARERVMVLMHPGTSPLAFVLPPGAWRLALDTAVPIWGVMSAQSERYEAQGPALCVLVQDIGL